MKTSGRILTRNAALVAGLSMMLGLLAYGLRAARAVTPIPKGTVMVGTGNGFYSEFTQTGTLIAQLNTTSGAPEETGCGFDPLTGNFFSTNFASNNVSEFDPAGTFIALFGSGYNAHPESIVFDGAKPENIYIGQADGSHEILKFDTKGNLLKSFTPTTDSRGTDWVDLAKDGCTIFYSSEGRDVERFNVCTDTQLTNFNTAPLAGSNAYAHRILLPSQFGAGGVLVADGGLVVRLDSTGADVQHYTIPDASVLFALNLDPDGTSFWTGDLGSGFVTKVDIKTGNIIQHWRASTAPNFRDVAGLCVKGELVAVPTPTPSKSSAVITAPAPISVTGVAGQTVKAGTFTLTNTSSVTETFTTITLALSNPGLFTSLKLDATFDESSSTGTSSSPSASTTITMSPSIVLPGHAHANFTLSAKLSSTTRTVVLAPDIRVAGVAVAARGGIGVRGPITLALGFSLLMLGFAPGPRWRTRRQRNRLMLGVVLLMFVVSVAGCSGGDDEPDCDHDDPCVKVTPVPTPRPTPRPTPVATQTPTPAPTPPPVSSTVTVTGAGGKDTSGGTVAVTGVPAKLSTVTRK